MRAKRDASTPMAITTGCRLCPPSCDVLAPPETPGAACEDEACVDCCSDFVEDAFDDNTDDDDRDDDVNPEVVLEPGGGVSVTDCVTSEVSVAVDTTVLLEFPSTTTTVVVLPPANVDGSEPEPGLESWLEEGWSSATSVLRGFSTS